MRKIIAFALLFVLSVADFGQEITIQTQKVKPETTPKSQKVKPKTAAKTQKVKPKIKPKIAVKTQKTKPKVASKTQKAKPKITAKTEKIKPKKETAPKITTIEAKTSDGKDIMLKADGTWAYKKPEPTPKTTPAAKPSPTPTPAPVAKTTPATKPSPVAKSSPTPVVKPSPVAKIKPSPTPSQCDLTLKDAPVIRGLRLGMTRDEADVVIPADRVTIINSSDIVSYPQFSNARGFESVYQISAQFSEDRLSAFDIIYDADDVKLKNAKEFAAALSKDLKLSPGFWKYNARNLAVAEMPCKEFLIKIDSSENEISLQKISAAQKTAQEDVNPKKVFKP